MTSKITAGIRLLAMDFRQFKKEYPYLAWWLGFFVLLTYGVRIVHDNIFLDSELMVLIPDSMHRQWVGINRFGLAFTSRLFGMSRLIPFVSCLLAAAAIWVSAIALSFAAYGWCKKSSRYRIFLYLFPALFVTSPVFAEQYLFVLQAFEISFAILLCILASICSGKAVYQKEYFWLPAGIPLMVWTFGSYQSMVPLYVCLVLLSYLLFYMNHSPEHALSQGFLHVAIFLAGLVLYGALALIIKSVLGIRSSYISDLIRWKTEGWRASLLWIWIELRNILLAKKPAIYSGLYLPSMCLFVLQAMGYGWKNKTSGLNYCCFLAAGGLFLASPFFLTLVMGCVQETRSQLVYPVTAACFLSHLAVPPPDGENLRKWRAKAWGLFAAIGLFSLFRNSIAAAQLFQSAWEAYRNDVLTANRIYEDICLVADRPDMNNCLVIFTGGRSAKLAGLPAMGDLSGLSFFGAEAHGSVGVSGRAGSLLLIHGMEIQIISAEQEDLYQQAVEFMRDAPDWPAPGSIRKMGEAVVVRLSESP